MPKSKAEVAAPVADKPQTKKSIVLAMLNAGGVSVADIAEKLLISRTAAYSLIGDVKRSGVAITGAVENGAMRYSAVQPKRVKAKASTFGKGPTVSADPE